MKDMQAFMELDGSILDKQHAKYDFQHEEEDGTVEGRDINNKIRLNN